MIQLYDYQQKYIKSLRAAMKKGQKKLILCAPTGSGKTVMFSYMASRANNKQNSVLVFTHRSELLTQAGGAFNEFGLNPEYINAGSRPDLNEKLHVAMIETFHRRIDEYLDFLQTRDVIIFDEAHLQNFNKILDYIDTNQYVIGATATPFRKGKERCLSENYDEIIQVVDTPELIKLGNLVPAISYGVNINLKGLKKRGDDYDTSQYYEENKIYKGVVTNYEKHALGKKTIVFASNVESSKRVCQEFIDKGYNARHVDGTSSDRDEIFKWFDITPNAILCNCGIATTGFDQKDIECVVLYRATTSLPLFLQMCGRGSRTYPNKKDFKILDFGNYIQRLGFWEDPRSWDIKKKPKTKEGQAVTKNCPSCEAMNYASVNNCVVCGYEFPEKEKEKTEEEIVLEVLKKHEIKGKLIDQLTMDELIICQKTKVLKTHFVWRVIRTKGWIEEYGNSMGYSRGWAYRQESEPTGFKNKRI
jgi:superfamily II DNA or RNA helicase